MFSEDRRLLTSTVSKDWYAVDLQTLCRHLHLSARSFLNNV